MTADEESRRDKAATWRQQALQTKEANERLQERVSDFKDALEESRTAAVALKARAQTLKIALDESRETLQNAKEQNSILRAALDENRDTLAQTKGHSATLRTALDKSKHSVQNLRQRNEKLTEELEELQAANEELEQRAAELEESLAVASQDEAASVHGPFAGDQEQAELEAKRGDEFEVLRFPFPFRSALAFVTDIDNTGFASFIRAHGCFYGIEPGYEGVELELANSFWFIVTEQRPGRETGIHLLDADGNERTDVGARLRPFVQSALFDTLHTYGDFAERDFTRELAERCTEYANRHAITPAFWTFHGNRFDEHNIRPGNDDWRGDDPTSDTYHLDLVASMGVRFFRMPPSLDLGESATRQVINARDGSKLLTQSCHATVRDAENIDEMREWFDGLTQLDTMKVEAHSVFKATDRLPRKVLLWHPEMLAFQIDRHILQSAVDDGRALYVNQHLSRSKSDFVYDYEPTKAALRHLSDQQQSGIVLTTSTTRLITFEFVRDNLTYHVDTEGDTRVVRIHDTVEQDGYRMPLRPEDLEGIGFTHSHAGPVLVYLGNRMLPTRRDTLADGRSVDHVPWQSRAAEQRDLLREFSADFADADG